jgi:bleomycin hydrolase
MGAAQSKPAAPSEKQALPYRAPKPSPEKQYLPTSDAEYEMVSPDAGILTDLTKRWTEDLLADPKSRLAINALSANNPTTILTSATAGIKDTQTFNIKIPFEGAPITNQRSSGRCWLFASTNCFRVAVMKHHNLKEFELSQSYLFFYDKLEKANFFLDQILDTLDEELDGRVIQALLASPVGDGGQFDMVANLVKKYGILPQAFYPDSWNAQNSSTMGRLMTTKLREDALILRDLAKKSPGAFKAGLPTIKAKMLREMHSILTLCLGPVPPPNKEFTWEFYDKDGKFKSFVTTPLKLASELSSSSAIRACGGVDVKSLFSLVNDPRNKYNSLLTVERLGNVVGGEIRYVNVDMDTMKQACIKMLQAGWPIFFGSDVGKYSNSSSGIMDTELIDYELGFNIRLGLDKAQRLRTSESAMTHAMVLTAVHVIDGKPLRWRVQNSWGTAAGTDGWFVMTDKWMDEFCYQAVVDPAFVSKEVRDVLDQEPTVLPLWDPMGALAQ